MDELEQPEQDENVSLGSNENYGKFKDAESLLKAYTNLEAEFTKKSQRLASLENENNIREARESKLAEINKKVDDFVTKFEFAKPFSNVLKENLANNENSNLEEEVMNLVANNYKRPEDYAKDSEFLNNYIFSNQEIKDKIVKDYLSKITQNSPIKVDVSSSNIPLSPPRVPTTIQEAGRMAKSIIKQK